MWRIWVLALGAFALGTDLFVIAGILPDVARDMRVSEGATGWLVSAFAFTYALAAPLLAVATGNRERRSVLVGSFSVFCAANVVSAIAPSYELLLASRIVAALGAALYMPTASALAAGLMPEAKRGRALAVVTGGLTVAIVLGVPLGTWIGGYMGWRMTFWFIVAAGLIALVGIRWGVPQVAAVAPVSLGRRMALLKQRQVFVALLLTVLWTAGGFTVYPYLGPLLTQLTHLSLQEIGWMLLLFGVAAVAGNLIGGYGADRRGTVATIAFALALLIPVFLTLAWSAMAVQTLALSLALWGTAGWMLTPPQQHRLIGLAPQISGAILGLNGSAIYLGMGIGTSVGALVIQRASVNWLGWVAAAFETLALVLLALSATVRKSPAMTR